MNKYERENIKHNFMLNTTNSWTWAKLTTEEQAIITHELENLELYASNSEQCYYILDKVYHAFLLGLGYNATDWRNKYRICETEMTKQEMEKCYKEITGLDNAKEFTTEQLQKYLLDIFKE